MGYNLLKCTEKEEELLRKDNVLRSLGLNVSEYPTFAKFVEILKEHHQIEVNDNNDWFSPNEAANALGVSRPHVNKLAKNLEWGMRKKGTHNQILKSDVLKYKAEWDKVVSAKRNDLLNSIANDFIDDEE